MFYKKKEIAIVNGHIPFRSVLANLIKEFDRIKLVFESRNKLAFKEKLKMHFPKINILALRIYGYDKRFCSKKLESSRLTGFFIGNSIQPAFSEKELAFLQLSCADLTYKEIAIQMNVSPRTIDNYRESLFAKLNIKSRTGLVVYGIKNGLIRI